MLIRTESELPCTPDAAWEALHRPEVAARLYAPALQMRARGGFPERFDTGDRSTVDLLLFGRVRLGSQLIHIEDHVPADAVPGARAMRDRGRPLTGPLVRLTRWQHQITILPGRGSHVPGADGGGGRGASGRAIWRDELSVGGAAAALFGPVLAVMWRVRRWKIWRLAGSWDAEFGARRPGTSAGAVGEVEF